MSTRLERLHDERFLPLHAAHAAEVLGGLSTTPGHSTLIASCVIDGQLVRDWIDDPE